MTHKDCPTCGISTICNYVNGQCYNRSGVYTQWQPKTKELTAKIKRGECEMKEQLVITKKEKGYEVILNDMTPKQLAKMLGWFICDYITKKAQRQRQKTQHLTNGLVVHGLHPFSPNARNNKF